VKRGFEPTAALLTLQLRRPGSGPPHWSHTVLLTNRRVGLHRPLHRVVSTNTDVIKFKLFLYLAVVFVCETSGFSYETSLWEVLSLLWSKYDRKIGPFDFLHDVLACWKFFYIFLTLCMYSVGAKIRHIHQSHMKTPSKVLYRTTSSKFAWVTIVK
jgi:hypothetical protein